MAAFAIDFTQVLIGVKGAPLMDMDVPKGAEPIPLTLGAAAAHALMADFPDERMPGREVSAEQKYRRAALALRIETEIAAILTSDEITLIKAMIAKGYPPLVMYRAWNALDPALGDQAAKAAVEDGAVKEGAALAEV